MSGHRCPTAVHTLICTRCTYDRHRVEEAGIARTGRAQQVAYLKAIPQPSDWVQATLQEHLDEMHTHGLCEDCGYPLDNTAPHPQAAS